MILGVGLTPEQLEKRRNGIGASDAVFLMSGDNEQILRLWREKRRLCDYEDLSDVLAVQMGQFTEELNVHWFEKKTGFHVKQRGLEIEHPDHPFIRATLDGVACLQDEDAIFEAKHVNPFNFSMEKIIEKYYPQVQHQMMCCGLELAVLSVLIGNMNWDWEIIPKDMDYQALLLDRELEFWECVQSGRVPCFTPIEPDLPQMEGHTIADMSGDDAWIDATAVYLETLDATKKNKKASERIKKIFPKNYCHAIGNCVKVSRSKDGSIRIRRWNKT